MKKALQIGALILAIALVAAIGYVRYQVCRQAGLSALYCNIHG